MVTSSSKVSALCYRFFALLIVKLAFPEVVSPRCIKLQGFCSMLQCFRSVNVEAGSPRWYLHMSHQALKFLLYLARFLLDECGTWLSRMVSPHVRYNKDGGHMQPLASSIFNTFVNTTFHLFVVNCLLLEITLICMSENLPG